MSKVPEEYKYTKTHEWVLRESNDMITIGITDHAQNALGDVVFVELPKVGSNVESGKEFAVIESVKAASDLYSPMTGKVVAVNDKLTADPALVNNSPYQEGWIIKVQPADWSQWEHLLDPQSYQTQIEQEE